MYLLFVVMFFTSADISQLKRADELYKNGKYEDALAIYQEQLNEEPGNFNIAFNIGNTLLKLGRYDDAKKAFQRAESLTKSAGQSADTYYNRSLSSIKAEEMDAAVKDLRTAIKLNPEDKDAKANYEIVSRLLDKRKQEQKQKKSKNDKDVEPSEYAKKVKSHTDDLVSMNKFEDAYKYITREIPKDATIDKAYQSYIERLRKVVDIENQY